MEGDPFAIVESMTIAAFATGCERAFIYIRGEYPLATERLQHAIDTARAHGMLGPNIMGHGFALDIEIRRGGGAYICGEETAIFNSIEGYRGEPRNKPPFPAESGVFRKPTCVNNVETLANVPFIVLNGGAAFAAIGTEDSTGTRLFCLSGAVERPGVYEVPFGATLRDLLALAGGPRGKRPLKAILLGGAAGVFVRPDELDIPLTFEGAREAKATLGSGVDHGVRRHDRSDAGDPARSRRSSATNPAASACRAAWARCGRKRRCTGSPRSERAAASRRELALLDEIGVAMKDASICGLGQTAYSAVESAMKRLESLRSGGRRMSALVQLRTPRRTVALTIDGEQVSVPEGTTILDAAAAMGKSMPTLCYLETLHPGERVPRVRGGGGGFARAGAELLAQGGSRAWWCAPNSERVKHSRKMVLEFLASSVDLSTTPNVSGWLDEYDCRPARYGPPAPAAAERRARRGAHRPPRSARPRVRRHRAPAAQERQRAVRARLRQVHPLLQVRRGVRHRFPEHLRDRRGGARLRRADLDRVRGPAPRIRRASTAATASRSAPRAR